VTNLLSAAATAKKAPAQPAAALHPLAGLTGKRSIRFRPKTAVSPTFAPDDAPHVAAHDLNLSHFTALI
jgi:hypothetical protein